MNWGRPSRSRLWCHVCLTLAALALILKIAVPPGYMLTSTSASPLSMVICTGQGPLVVNVPQSANGDQGHVPSPADKSSHDAPCAWAGHGVASPPPSLATLAVSAFAPAAIEDILPAVAPAPGRGLLAPPPPARGPPQLI